MDRSLCQKIDDEFLIEEYVAGKLSAAERQLVEDHIRTCEKHAQAVAFEKAMRRGVTEYARDEIKSRLKKAVRRRADTKFYLLRYAAILFVGVLTPLILYYQFQFELERYRPSSLGTVIINEEGDVDLPAAAEGISPVSTSQLAARSVKSASPTSTSEEEKIATSETADQFARSSADISPAAEDISEKGTAGISEDSPSEINIPPAAIVKEASAPVILAEKEKTEQQETAETLIPVAKDYPAATEAMAKKRVPATTVRQRSIAAFPHDETFMISGGDSLSRKIVFDYMESKKTEILACPGLMDNDENLPFTVSFVLLPGGFVEEPVKVRNPNLSEGTMKCIAEKISAWKFGTSITDRMAVKKTYTSE